MRRKNPAPRGALAECQSGLTAIHRGSVKYSVDRRKGFMQNARPATRPGARAGMDFHRCAHVGGEISRQIEQVERLGKLENDEPRGLCCTVYAASVLEDF